MGFLFQTGEYGFYLASLQKSDFGYGLQQLFSFQSGRGVIGGFFKILLQIINGLA